jgi:site-specific recombinase XerD
VAGERLVSAAVTLTARVEQYLAERRRLGFDLRTMGYSLRSLAEHVRKAHHRGALTVELMAAWARQARQGARTQATWARRLRRLRPFTRWLQQFEPATEVPDESIFGPIPGRLAPHIYRDEEVIALLQAAGRLNRGRARALR